MNLIATLGMIYTSLQNPGLSDYQLSLPPHMACYYIQTGHRRGGRWEVVSQLQQQCTLSLCSVDN